LSSPIFATAPAPPPWSTGSGESCCSSPDQPGRVGRDGRLHLAFVRRGDRTVLTERRFTLPLQALDPVDLDGSGGATLMLLNPTGGVVGGDVLETRVSLGPGARVCLTTPAATRIYRSAGAPAEQRFTATVAQDAVLEYLPDHLIPSPGARLRQTTEIALDRGATLLLSDAWAVGRLARGERWRFDELDLALTIRDDGKVVLRERSRLCGPPRDGLGGTEGLGYVATFVAAAPDGDRWDALARDLHQVLADLQGGARFGVSALGRGGVLARLLCPSAPSLEASVGALWGACRRLLLRQPPLGLRKL
jgi:urease accessory protein